MAPVFLGFLARATSDPQIREDALVSGEALLATNPIGPLEDVEPEWAELLTGKTVNVVHNSDRAGLIGANKWVEATARRYPAAAVDHEGRALSMAKPGTGRKNPSPWSR